MNRIDQKFAVNETIFLSVGLRIGLLGLVLCLFSLKAYCQEPPLKVEIAIAKNIFTEYFQQSGGRFLVSTKIKNISQKDQIIHYWGCSYEDSWISNHSQIVIEGRSCRRNVVLEKTLMPDEEFIRNDLKMAILPNANQEEILLQLGYDPAIPLHPTDEQMQIDKDRVIWSNTVKINVTAQMLDYLADKSLDMTMNNQDIQLNVDLVGFGCIGGFGGWTEPPKDEKEEYACDRENLKNFQDLKGQCNGLQVSLYDLDHDNCVSCNDYAIWKKDIKRLHQLHKRSTDGQGYALIDKECEVGW
ncbi:MAG: hypothetical protein H6753_06235 [Candidatus Omnitrophica bacterium]|nr:hypothetical protein [Candidatus Omnitrophota bacterium]